MVEYLSVNLTYPNGVQALKDVNLVVKKGEFVFLVGSTGSGKSSLLKMIHRELEPTTGAVYVDRQDISELKKHQIPYLRRKLGVIFQDFRVLPHKTAYENVAFALEVTGVHHRYIRPRVRRALELVSLSEKSHRLPGEMSGGEQQRVAIARALVNEPVLLIGDEPTGNLDPDTSWDIMQTLSQINASGTTVMVATHNSQIVDVMRKRVLVMQRGTLLRDEERGRYTAQPEARG
ncbi:MAG: cell division ATP-binding protein FtsE [Candidatus Eremiobacteraeota bacterium]|nr:cell division ATP-binding protein FtsE [Candidatus Eremiobacteraeota bacterium]MCW5869650.1 cell division ATP-binding protein FtsE [Candidatus Eremiobacteraeota bacterium]